jgi:rare lipoprotein A
MINCSPSARYASNRSTNTEDSQTEISEDYVFYGEASYYAEKFHGKQTANGEIFDMYKISAAHKTLPFNTILKVTNLENKKSVVVRVNDRGPYKNGRVLDLSYQAAQEIDMISSGVIKVKIQIVKMGTT